MLSIELHSYQLQTQALSKAKIKFLFKNDHKKKRMEISSQLKFLRWSRKHEQDKTTKKEKHDLVKAKSNFLRKLMSKSFNKAVLTANFLPASIDLLFTCTPPLAVKRADFISSSMFGPIFSVTVSLAREISVCSSSGECTPMPLTSKMTSPAFSRPCLSIIPPEMILATISWLYSSSSTVSPRGSLGIFRMPTIFIVSPTGIVFPFASRSSFFVLWSVTSGFLSFL